MTIDPEEKLCKHGKIEKDILRKAFEGYLPNEILYRQKEQFSDGVGYGWIDGLKNYAEKIISDQQMQNAKHAFKYNTPKTKEAYLYRSIFKELFPDHSAAQTVKYFIYKYIIYICYLPFIPVYLLSIVYIYVYIMYSIFYISLLYICIFIYLYV